MEPIDTQHPVANRRSWRVEPMTADEKALLDRDERISFTQANSSPALFSVAGAAGIWISDHSGRKYMDFYGNNCHHVGYQHPLVLARVREQLERYTFVSRGLTSETSVQLGELLIASYPIPDSKVLFVPGGAAAVELALMIAKVHTGRHKTISFWDSYHGRSAGALSVGGTPRDRSPRMGPLMPGALHALPFYWHARRPGATSMDMASSAQASLESLRVIFEHEKDIAAVIGESVRNGPYMPPDGYWRRVREMCDSYGALLIFDEIPTGLGKTGRLFNSEHFDVMPDMTLLGKALGGAVAPLAAVIARSELDTAPELNLSYFTHEKNALSAAAGLATLSTIIEGKLPERARMLGEMVTARLTALQARRKTISNTRCVGLMFAVDFSDAADGRSGADVAQQVYFAALRRGLLAMNPKANVLSFSAPLVISEDDLEHALDTLDEAVQAVA